MSLERAYLFVFGSVILLAVASLGLFWIDFTWAAYLMAASAIHHLPTAVRELRASLKFSYAALGISIVLTLFPRLFQSFFIINPYIHSIVVLSYNFAAVGMYFWLLKAEYIWSPHAKKRLDLLIFCTLATIHLFLNAISMLAWINVHIMMQFMRFDLWRITEVFELVYYAILLFITGKLYFEARNNGGGLRRWN